MWWPAKLHTVKGNVGAAAGTTHGTVRNAGRNRRWSGWGRAAEERMFASGSDTDGSLSKGKGK